MAADHLSVGSRKTAPGGACAELCKRVSLRNNVLTFSRGDTFSADIKCINELESFVVQCYATIGV